MGPQAQAVQAAVAGFARSASLADSRVSASVLRLDKGGLSSDQLGRLVLWETAQIARESDARYVANRRHVRRTRPWAPTEGKFGALPQRGVWFVTGGLGGVGVCFSRYPARHSQARLVLVGRAPLDERKKGHLDELESFGAQALYLQADVTDRGTLERALHQARTTFGHIDGVIHAAGIMGSQGLLHKGFAEFQQVTAVKIRGAFLLDELTRDDPLKYFVLFSSLAASVGDLGHGDYGAANSFLDEFAVLREAWRVDGRRHGTTVSLEWPLWEAGGIKFVEQGRDLFLQFTGMTPLTETAGTNLLPVALGSGNSILLAAAGDRAKLTMYLNGESRRGEEPGASPVPGNNSPVPGTEASELALQGALRDMMAQVLRVSAERIDAALSFSEYGFDSITLKEFAQAIGNRWAISLSPTVFFTHATLHDLTQYLLQVEGVALACREAPAPTDDAPRTAAEVRAPEPHEALAPTEAIAIIGMAGRFPGSRDLNEFWQHLIQGDDLVGPPPIGRCPEQDDIGLTGGFLAEIDRFDADFFQLSPREAELMDPQHRVLLETVWHALEDAACRPSSLAGSKTGVFVGVQSVDYQDLVRDVIDGQVVTGTAHALLANRVSYLLDLHGPSEAIDTACSSSLVAVHRAVQSLRSGESNLAIAGGVNLLVSSRTSELVREMGVLSADGRCKVFDRSANGYVRGEGAGVVVLKPLTQALAAGDPIRAVIRGSAVNHGGRATSLTAPNPVAQSDLLQAAWADVPLESIGYLEAHGTGTELGDPLEIEGIQRACTALAQKQGLARLSGHRCGLGSLKSNIGHLEPASGIASLIKVVLALRHRQLPPTLHVQEINPLISLGQGPLFLVTEPTTWPVSSDSAGQPFPRRAGVSSFGFGGVNAHVLLEEAPPSPNSTAPDEPSQVIVLSARTEPGLRHQVEQLRGYLSGEADLTAPGFLVDLAFTLQTGREAFEHRLALVAASHSELRDLLDRFLAGSPVPDQLFTGGSGERMPWRQLLQPEPSTPLLRELAARGSQADVARTWVQGATLDWNLSQPRGLLHRLHLPGYPFEGKRHWVSFGAKRAAVERRTVGSAPLESEPLGDGTGFHFLLKPDHWYLSEHRVQGQSVLPAAASLELARAAADQLAPPGKAVCLEDVTWPQALVAPVSATPLELHCRSGDTPVFELTYAVGNARRVIARGKMRFAEAREPRPVLDLAAIRTRCPTQVTGAEIVARLACQGLHYGPSFQMLEMVWGGEQEAVGEFRSLKNVSLALIRLVVLDAAMQMTAALSQNTHPGSWVPFHVDKVEFLGEPLEARFAILRRVGATMDLDATITDAQGRSLIEVRGFRAQPWRGGDTPAPALSFLAPVWEETSQQGDNTEVRLGRVLVFRSAVDSPLFEALRAVHSDLEEVILGGAFQKVAPHFQEIDAREEEDFQAVLSEGSPIQTLCFFSPQSSSPEKEGPRRLERSAQGQVFTLLRLLRALCRLGRLSQPLSLRVVTWDVQTVKPTDRVCPAGGILVGLCRAVALEFPQVELCCIDLSSNELEKQDVHQLAKHLLRETAAVQDGVVAWRAGARYLGQLKPLQLPPGRDQLSGLRVRGVYWIIGGAGGLGTVFARHLAERVHGAHCPYGPASSFSRSGSAGSRNRAAWRGGDLPDGRCYGPAGHAAGGH